MNNKIAKASKLPSRTRLIIIALFFAIAVVGWFAWKRFHEVVFNTDVLIIGTGISGMGAAHQTGQLGAKVTVIDMNSVFGGNAVLSEGGLFIVNTPLQLAEGYHDSPESASIDMLAWGEDADTAWVNTFTHTARTEIWDYLTSLGVHFTALRQQAGNQVPRFHENAERGLGLLRPIYRECLKYPNITFRWNTRIERLLKSGSGAIQGATGRDLRTGAPVRINARSVILATGGFQGNERLVRKYWHAGWPQPDRLLLGASDNSSGSGFLMGMEAGAATHRLDHQWHYPFGVPDPRFPGENRAVSVRNLNSIWINAQGERFVNEWSASRFTVEAVVRQQPSHYWIVFDEPGVDDLRYSGTDWADLELAKRLIVNDTSVTKKGYSLNELARATGLPSNLEATINRYNSFVENSNDLDFQRFGVNALPNWLMVFIPPKPRILDKPPFYAIKAFPMTRKNMGGLRIDLDCRVLDLTGQPISGLFAVGEVAGLGGVNGKAGLEGTFLGPALVQGRRAARAAVPFPSQVIIQQPLITSPGTDQPPQFVCNICHKIPMAFFGNRSGYSHFKRAHKLAKERDYLCSKCHDEIELIRPWHHHISTLTKVESCSYCHLPTPTQMEIESGINSSDLVSKVVVGIN